MVRILAQAILSAAGVVVALFVSRDAVGFPVYEMVGTLLLIAALAVIVWYGPRVVKALFGPRSKE
ncbi:hypothetical protein F9K97_21605 [Brucella anthropi]|jgi:hypothetical protein|uniref:Uncharacterized protein n=1 Tax=Brucella anthropi TaxID=529 RepID=A0A6I0D5L8_BRUAN|nr:MULTISPECIES: hypothetical protein [Hyphomicrobiales]KAB2761292.1 hypothetical protein F9K98_18490 [Brucella anthropi]KAB2769860.1 hypothetical protein F9L04_11485 [Brucella anthropi]KAB2773974.1 hypothetical protein F9L00_23240 [Brucella anthropi]KAB2779904.1 hypothetical protein F9K97_21605 [Brucella anthropi]MCQ9148235.1 hypothetical protein [Ochrobactrum sp. BTU2]